MLSYKNTILFSLFAVNLIDQPAPLVRIEQGIVRGKISRNGRIHEYMGIPYATTEGRFQPPLPPPSWDGVYQAVDEHYQCPQAMGPLMVGMEDCLKINVYVPALATNKPLPVMFQIHGGAFVLGNGGKMLHGPDFLVKHDVILVTFNYRLGALGFLCLGIKEAPGSAGLKDQIAALKWVKKNIAAFGGDPDNVTIFGHSAGGASTALLVMSEATHGIFNKAIVQSGSALLHWVIEDGVAIASNVAKLLGYDTKDPRELYNIFLTTPIKDIVMATKGMPLLHLSLQRVMFQPCVEKEFPGIEPVFKELPYNIIKRNNPKNISVIYGLTDREGMFFIYEENDDHLDKHNEELYNYPDFEFPSEEVAQSVAKKVKEFYLGDKIASRETRNNLEQLFGDAYFDVPLMLESELMVNRVKAPIYHYYFKYAGNRNLVKNTFSSNKSEPGASHGDDILYIFDGFVYPFKVKEKDQKIIDWMTKMWTNFAKYGNPTPLSDKYLPIEWKPSTKENINFLIIDDKLEIGPFPNPDRYNLWKDLYAKYRVKKPRSN